MRRTQMTGPSIASALLLVSALSTPLAAHDFWIEPSTFDPAVNSAVQLHLRVGEEFLGEQVARNNERIRRFIAIGPQGSHAVVGRDGAAPAGLARFDTPGLWVVAYESRPSYVRLAPALFDRYLREEGLEQIISDRRSRGETGRDGRERFFRSVKTLIRVGKAAADGDYRRPVGLPLELIPEQSPFSGSGSDLPVRLLFSGVPLDGALLVAMRKDVGSTAPAEIVARVRTDHHGRAVLPTGPGVWLIKAVHMVRATQPGADWESIWTSLTFRVDS